jgi:phosphoesterase RecJ-like protein
MFRKVGEQVKISFRSAGDIDVGVIAQALGGGGHDHSAATIIEGEIEEIISEVIPKISAMLK